ncbi:MAG: SLC5 family protein [Alphaproteobacteria bacterium]|nr:SLC5 family protein [Alphaproteobacteria bacterium]
MQIDLLQIAIFFGITALIGLLTYLKCREPRSHLADQEKDLFLAGGTLSWAYIAGSITLTNLSTDQLVGMNGNQLLLIAWWEFAAVMGLVILATVFLPLYYKHDCTTTTELLEKRLGGKALRALISVLFLLGGLFIYLPIMLYTGSLFMQSLFDIEAPLIFIASAFAVLGAAYALFGGLRAVAVSDTYSGVGLLGFGLLVVYLALQAIDFDFSGIPAERLTLIGGPDSPIPFATLFTGMLFIQIFYWSFNQTITQRAMAAPSIREAQKGVFAAAGIRLMIVPAIIAIPGVVSYKLYGDIGDAAYGRIVGDVLPAWLTGAFAAMMAAAVLTSFNSALNSAAALYVCDIHDAYVAPFFQRQFEFAPSVRSVATIMTISFVALAVALVPAYSGADSIINLVQQLNGLLSMPILSAFFVAIFFRNVSPWAVALAVVIGCVGYGIVSFYFNPVHYIHMMLATLVACMAFALLVNAIGFGRIARFTLEDFSTFDLLEKAGGRSGRLGETSEQPPAQ